MSSKKEQTREKILHAAYGLFARDGFCKVTMKDVEEYPCLSFEQGEKNSFYLSEEVLSTYEYKRIIKANDRATMFNLMRGLNAYTLC